MCRANSLEAKRKASEFRRLFYSRCYPELNLDYWKTPALDKISNRSSDSPRTSVATNLLCSPKSGAELSTGDAFSSRKPASEYSYLPSWECCTGFQWLRKL